MSIVNEVEVLLAIVPKIEKIISDAKSAEQSPAGVQLISDLEDLIAEVKTLVPSTNVTPAA